MLVLSIIAAAVAPGIALLVFFYLKEKSGSEPVLMVVRVFLYGVLLVYPTMVLQRAIVVGTGDGDHPFVYAFLLSAGIEEFVKWFVIYYVIYRHTVFSERYDGIVYAVAISLGYATLENIMYAFLYDASFSFLLYRALLPVSAHALFGVVMGYYLGKAKFVEGKERRYLAYALLLPVLWHGSFDFILLVTEQDWVWFMMPLMMLYWFRAMRKVNRANSGSAGTTLPPSSSREVKF